MMGRVRSVAVSSLSVIFPAYQEEQYLGPAVEAVLISLAQPKEGRTFDWFEVITVENGSKDRTRAIAVALAAKHPEVKALSIDTADYGTALRTGLLAATGDLVVNFDVDFYDFDFLYAAVDLIESPGGPSIVVATKRGEGSVDTRHWSRRFVTGVFTFLLRHGFGLKVSDTHGMKAMRRIDVAPLAEKCLFGIDLFDTELILRVERAGYVTAELPCVIRETRPARTKMITRIWRSVKGLARLWIALRRETRIKG